eukprot:jgi/Antlo1/1779/2359
MGRVIPLLLLVATAISKDIFEPTDLDKIFKTEGDDSASEKKDELQKTKPESKDVSKDKQYIGFQYGNESTTTCFINPQTSDKKIQKAQLSYVVSLSSLLSKVSSTQTNTSIKTSSLPALDKSNSVLSSLASSTVLLRGSSLKSTASTSTYKTKERSEKTSVHASVTSKDEKKLVPVHNIMAATVKHREEVPAVSLKKKQEKKESVKGKYWTTVMAYGSPEKVLIGVKTITIIESIIQEPSISGAAASIVKTALGEKGDVSYSNETMKVGNIVMPSQSLGGPQHQDVGNITKSTSKAGGRSLRSEIAAEMPAQTKKEKSKTTNVEEKTPRTTYEAMSQSSSSTKHTTSTGVVNTIEKLTIAIPVQKDLEYSDVVYGVSKFALPASQTTRENKHREKGDAESKTARTTKHSKEDKATASKAATNVFGSASVSSDTSSESTSSSSETAFTEEDKNLSTVPKSSVTVIMVKHFETRSSSPVVSSSATSGLNISSIQHSLSQVIEKAQKSLVSSLASITSTKKEEKEPEKAAMRVSAGSARLSVSTSGRAFSKQVSVMEPRTQKHGDAKKKASQSSTTSTVTKKRKEGFGGLGIWKRIGDFSNDGEESSRDTAERNSQVSSTAVKNVSEKKEGGVKRSIKSDSIVDILTVLSDVSKKSEENTKIFIDGDFQAKKSDKKIGNKLKFKGWISNSTNE